VPAAAGQVKQLVEAVPSQVSQDEWQIY